MSPRQTSLKILRAGSCLVDRSVVVQGEPRGRMVTFPVWMYLLRGPDTVALVDTGMPSRCIGDDRFFDGTDDEDLILPRMKTADTLEAVLAREGLGVADIDMLISTHWHFDHAGSNQAFRRQPILVHPDEIACAKAGHSYPPECRDLTLDYRDVRDGDSPLPGVRLLHTPGHTPGHLSLLVEPPGVEPVLLTVDAVYTEVNWTQGTPGAMADESLGSKSVDRLREVAQSSGARVFFGHDPSQAEQPQWQALQG